MSGIRSVTSEISFEKEEEEEEEEKEEKSTAVEHNGFPVLM